ncbi:MAG: hypothetical protein GC179_15540 [Anaerolineaceae bacterium]|nr:hypothetical protein [Anaerolineaceae bacterium]
MRKRKIIIGCVGFLFLTVLCVFFFSPLYNRPFLTSELLPTAEYLFKSPSDQPRWINIKPPPGSIINTGKTIDIYLNSCESRPYYPEECDGFLLVKDDSFEATGLYQRWSNFFINGQKATLLPDGIVGNGNHGTVITRVNPLLFPGYHLFKIEAANSPEAQNSPDPKLTYEWAYRVE